VINKAVFLSLHLTLTHNLDHDIKKINQLFFWSVIYFFPRFLENSQSFNYPERCTVRSAHGAARRKPNSNTIHSDNARPPDDMTDVGVDGDCKIPNGQNQ